MSTQKIDVGGFVYEANPPKREIHAGSAVLAAITVRMRQWLAEFVRQRAFLRAEQELAMFDDRMLRDIGLSRSEIASAVRNAGQERLNGAQPQVPAQF